MLPVAATCIKAAAQHENSEAINALGFVRSVFRLGKAIQSFLGCGPWV